MIVVWVAIVALIWWGLVMGLRALWAMRHPHSASVGGALYSAQRFRWHVSIGSRTRVESLIPDDPASARQVIEHVRGTDRGIVGDAVVMSERVYASGAEERVFYVLAPCQVDGSPTDGAVVFCRSLDSVTRAHASRGEFADRVVRAIREAAPNARMVWVARGHVGVGLDAETVTNPAAWARWLGEVVEDIDAGRPPGHPPASW